MNVRYGDVLKERVGKSTLIVGVFESRFWEYLAQTFVAADLSIIDDQAGLYISHLTSYHNIQQDVGVIVLGQLSNEATETFLEKAAEGLFEWVVTYARKEHPGGFSIDLEIPEASLPITTYKSIFQFVPGVTLWVYEKGEQMSLFDVNSADNG